MGSGGRPGMVTDDSEIFRLDNLESVAAGGALGAHIFISSSLK